MPFPKGVRLTLKLARPKDYSDQPQALGEHLKKRRKELGLLQREVAAQMGINHFTYINWEKDKTQPVASRFRPVLDFLGYDPSPPPATLSERLQAKRRALGVTFGQVARYLGWDEGTLTRYLNGTWDMTSKRRQQLEAFLTASSVDPGISRLPAADIGSTNVNSSEAICLLSPPDRTRSRCLRAKIQ